MLVYRVCCKKEIDLIFLNHNFNAVGNSFLIKPKKSTHNYIPNKMYMHFFLNKIDVFNICSSSGNFICVYDIPDALLEDYKGYGFYLNYFLMDEIDKIKEFAIPSDMIKFDYLVRIDRIETDIDFYDYLEDPTLNLYTKKIYVKKQDLVLSRKK